MLYMASVLRGCPGRIGPFRGIPPPLHGQRLTRTSPTTTVHPPPCHADEKSSEDKDEGFRERKEPGTEETQVDGQHWRAAATHEVAARGCYKTRQRYAANAECSGTARALLAVAPKGKGGETQGKGVRKTYRIILPSRRKAESSKRSVGRARPTPPADLRRRSKGNGLQERPRI